MKSEKKSVSKENDLPASKPDVAGKSVRYATPEEARAAAASVKQRFAGTLKNLKNR